MTALLAIAAQQIASTALDVLYDIATAIGALSMLCFALTVIVLRIARRAERKEAKAAALEDATIAMLDRWKDKPGIIPDALDREIRQWLAEGEHRD